MNGWSNWEKEGPDLNLGNEALSFFDNKPDTLSSIAPAEKPPTCTDSSQCASGYACVDGECVSVSGAPGSSNTTPSYPSSGSPGTPTGGSPSSGPGIVYPPRGSGYPARGGSGGGSGGLSGCGQDPYPGSGNNNTSPCTPGTSNTPSKCTKTGCGGNGGNDGLATDCCGEDRCCRYSGSGVQCWCGACPPLEKPCNVWCDQFKSATGDLYSGCDEEVVCDECSECGIESRCTPNTFDAPCWCEQSECNSIACTTCGEDGICRQNCNDCMYSWKRDYQCPCGTVTQQCRFSACDTNVLHCAVPDCSSACGEEPDPCEGECYGQSFCDSTPPPCPPGSSCTDNGTISAGGSTCYIRTVCDKTNVPEKCKECDCNCDNDCVDCEICNAAGVCVPDPACPDCDGPICPQAPGGCCESGEICYKPAPDQDGRACCNGPRVVSIYVNEVRTGLNSISTYLSVGGPLQMSIVSACDCGGGYNCSGQPVNCTDPSARSRLRLANYYGVGDDPCDGGSVRCLSYQDPLCNWSDGPFDPVLLSTTLYETRCCSS